MPNLKYGTYYSATNAPGNKTQRLIIVVVIIAVVLGGGLFALTLLNGNSKNDLTLLAVRENSLVAVTGAPTNVSNIRNPDLSTANSNATILLTSDVSNLVINGGVKQLPGDLVKKEADTNGDNLKQAALLDKFDITYRQLIMQKVEALIAEAQALRSTLNTKSTKSAVDQSIVNLQAIDKQFTQLKL